MPKARETEKFLVQVRLTAAQRTRIKSLAARQNMTVQKAVVEAFEAWAEKLRSRPAAQPSFAPAPLSFAWLSRAVNSDWSQCPDAELLEDGQHQLWVVRDTDVPLTEVLRAAGEGYPVSQIAKIFDLDPSQLAKVIEFAG